MKAWKSERFKSMEMRDRPWREWFAWYPVRTIGGKLYWWTKVYRKCGNNYVDYDNWTWYFYADDFDVIKEVEFVKAWDELKRSLFSK